MRRKRAVGIVAAEEPLLQVLLSARLEEPVRNETCRRSLSLQGGSSRSGLSSLVGFGGAALTATPRAFNPQALNVLRKASMGKISVLRSRCLHVPFSAKSHSPNGFSSKHSNRVEMFGFVP